MHAVIIGGGVIGLFSAWYLRQAGWKVTVADRGDMTNGCSYGNAGIITPSHFVPLAAPGVLKQGLKWMLRPGSPFSIYPDLSGGTLRWGLQFVRHANDSHVKRSAVPLRDLLLLGRTLYEDLTAGKQLDPGLRKKGLIMYYRTAACAAHELQVAAMAGELGLETEVCDRDRLRELEPELDVKALGGIHYKCDAHLYPPWLMKQLIRRLEGQVNWARMEVRDFSRSKGKILAARGPGGEISGDLFVLAAGCWSGKLAAALGLRLLLMPGKGYSVTVEKPPRLPVHPAILCEARVAITPAGGLLRYGGTMEIGARRETIGRKRVAGLVHAVNQYLPGLEVAMPPPERVWAGFRPVSADGLPYIGRPANFGNLIIATGHAMTGLGMAPATGKIVSQLAGEEKPLIGLEAFRPDRF